MRESKAKRRNHGGKSSQKISNHTSLYQETEERLINKIKAKKEYIAKLDKNSPSNNQDLDTHFVDNNSNKLLIIFASNGLAVEEGRAPSFNFMGTLNELKSADKLFVRDQRRLFYLMGLKNSTKNLRETILYLKRYIEANNIHV